MQEFSPKARKGALMLHVVCCATWMGAATGMMVLILWRGGTAETDESFATIWMAIKTIDDLVIIAAAGSSFLSGCLLCWGTKWGFFKWYWVAIKFVLTAILVVFGATCLGPWINQAAAIAAEQGASGVQDLGFRRLYSRLCLWGSLQMAVLLAIFWLSVFKPWSRIRKSLASK